MWNNPVHGRKLDDLSKKQLFTSTLTQKYHPSFLKINHHFLALWALN